MIEYRVTTYESSTHTYVIQILTSTDSQFQHEIVQTEQMYGRFIVRSSREIFEKLRNLVNENSIYTLTLEHGI